MVSVSNRAIEFIQDQLAARELSVNALAKLMNESQSTVNRAVRGDVDLSFERLYKICKVLHIDMHDVIDHVETGNRKKKRA